MPTESHKPLLDRELSKAAVAPKLLEASGALTEIVNYGTQLFARGSASADAAYERLAKLDPHLPTDPPMGDFHLPILLLYTHGLDMVDAVQVLLAEAVVTPAHLPVRALFEAMLQLEWILHEDTARRAFAYQFFDVRERLRFYQSLDPATQEGREFASAKQADVWVGQMVLRQVPDLDKRMAALHRLLTQPGYKEAAAEYERMKKAGKKIPAWYALYDGPQKVQQLARRLGRSLQYEVLYRYWSSAVHGTQVARRLDSRGGITPMRHTETLSDVVQHTVNHSLTLLRLFAKFYRPGEEESFGRWYIEHIRPVLIPKAQGAAPLS